MPIRRVRNAADGVCVDGQPMKSYRRRARAAILLFLRSLLSFRVLMALTTSASVTASVAGPMAYQANKAREQMEVAAAAPAASTTTLPPSTAPGRPDPTDPDDPTTTTSTTSTTTTTTTPESTTVATPTTVGPTVPGETTTTVPAVTSEGLFVSQRADHSVPESLDNTRVGRRVWVFFDGPDVQRVRYWIDNPSGAGAPDRVSTTPFDLGVNGFDFSSYSDGPHSLLAEVLTVSGTTYQRFAQFTVRNN